MKDWHPNRNTITHASVNIAEPGDPVTAAIVKAREALGDKQRRSRAALAVLAAEYADSRTEIAGPKEIEAQLARLDLIDRMIAALPIELARTPAEQITISQELGEARTMLIELAIAVWRSPSDPETSRLARRILEEIDQPVTQSRELLEQLAEMHGRFPMAPPADPVIAARNAQEERDPNPRSLASAKWERNTVIKAVHLVRADAMCIASVYPDGRWSAAWPETGAESGERMAADETTGKGEAVAWLISVSPSTFIDPTKETTRP